MRLTPCLAPLLPDALGAAEAASLGLGLAGPMPGQPTFTLVTAPEGDSLCVGTLGTGQRAADAPRSLAAMLYAGELDRDQAHSLALRLAQRQDAPAVQLWQAGGGGNQAPCWLFAWLSTPATAAAAGAALRALHGILDGIVGDPASPSLHERALAGVRRAGTCLARKRYIMAAGALVDLSQGAHEGNATTAAATAAGDAPGKPGPAGSLGIRLPTMPWSVAPAAAGMDAQEQAAPDPATSVVGSVEWLLGTAARMGTWDGSDATVNIRRLRGGGWYGAHTDGCHPMLRRLPRGTFGYASEDYVCYVVPLAGRKKTFVIHSSAGASDARCAPVLEEICRQAPGTRVVRRALPAPSRPLFMQPDRLPPLTIHEEL